MKLPKQIWETKVNWYNFHMDGIKPNSIKRKDKKLIRKIKRNIIKQNTKNEIEVEKECLNIED